MLSKENQTPELSDRLAAYCGALKAASGKSPLRQSQRTWQTYAAVTGSALAMATNAAAGNIVWSGVQNVGASVSSVLPNTFVSNGNIGLLLNRAGTAPVNVFGIGVGQSNFGSLVGSVFMPRGEGVEFLHVPRMFGNSSTDFAMSNFRTAFPVKKLASGDVISSGAGRFGGDKCGCIGDFLAGKRPGQNSSIGWSASNTGLAGFSFAARIGKSSTSYAASANAPIDFGWVRLVYTVGLNGLPNSVTAVDWAYDDSGAPIAAGDTGSSSAPEPSAFAMGLLALGAAGVTALRRRRKVVAALPDEATVS